MRMKLHQRSTAVSDDLRARIEKKISKLDRYFNDDTEASVKITEERGGQANVEITINLDNGTVLRAEEKSYDAFESFDKVIDKVIRQMRKHRTKFEKRLRAGAFEQPEPDVPEAEEADWGKLVRVKRFEMKPMSTEDAIAQMDLLGHSFFMYFNVDTNSTCLVYKRQDGDIGMLEPTNA